MMPDRRDPSINTGARQWILFVVAMILLTKVCLETLLRQCHGIINLARGRVQLLPIGQTVGRREGCGNGIQHPPPQLTSYAQHNTVQSLAIQRPMPNQVLSRLTRLSRKTWSSACLGFLLCQDYVHYRAKMVFSHIHAVQQPLTSHLPVEHIQRNVTHVCGSVTGKKRRTIGNGAYFLGCRANRYASCMAAITMM